MPLPTSPSPTTTLASRLGGLASGTINRVAIDVSGEPHARLARQTAAMLARE